MQQEPVQIVTPAEVLRQEQVLAFYLGCTLMIMSFAHEQHMAAVGAFDEVLQWAGLGPRYELVDGEWNYGVTDNNVEWWAIHNTNMCANE